MHLFYCTWWPSWKLFHHNIRKLIKDEELRACSSFVDMVKIFLRWDENYRELVEKLLKSLQDIGSNMSIKVHLLRCHLDKFLDNCGDVSDEQRKRFYQDLKTMKDRYQGRWDKRIMADNCWSIKSDLNNVEHDRQSRKRNFLPLFLCLRRFYFCCLLKDLMKILVGPGIFYHVIFKDVGSDCYGKNSILQ